MISAYSPNDLTEPGLISRIIAFGLAGPVDIRLPMFDPICGMRRFCAAQPRQPA